MVMTARNYPRSSRKSSQSLLGLNGSAQGESRALSELRVCSQGPSVEAGQRGRYEEAEAVSAAIGGVGAVKPLEDGGEFGRRDAFAPVAHPDDRQVGR